MAKICDRIVEKMRSTLLWLKKHSLDIVNRHACYYSPITFNNAFAKSMRSHYLTMRPKISIICARKIQQCGDKFMYNIFKRKIEKDLLGLPPRPNPRPAARGPTGGPGLSRGGQPGARACTRIPESGGPNRFNSGILPPHIPYTSSAMLVVRKWPFYWSEVCMDH